MAMPLSVALRGAAGGYGAPLDQPERKGPGNLPGLEFNLGGWLTDASQPIFKPIPPAGTPAPAPAPPPPPPAAGPAQKVDLRNTSTPPSDVQKGPSEKNAAAAAPAHAAAQAYNQNGPQQQKPANQTLRVQIEGGDWVEYDPNAAFGDPRLRGALHSPRDSFASSRAGQALPGTYEAEHGGQAPSDPRALSEWTQWKEHRERERIGEDAGRAQAEAATEQSRAVAERARMLQASPMEPELIAADARKYEANIKAGTEATRREAILGAVQRYNAEIAQLAKDPRVLAMKPEERAALIEGKKQELFNVMTLMLSALVEHNLYQKPDILTEMAQMGMGAGAQAKKKE